MPRTASRLAWSFVGFSLLLSVAAIWLSILNGTTSNLIDSITVTVLATLPFTVIGALIASRFHRNAIGWIFCAVGVFQALTVSGYEYARYTLVTAPGSLPLG